MWNTFSEIYIIIFGALSIYFAKKIGIFASKRWEKAYKQKADPNMWEYPARFIGFIFIVFGILGLLGIIHFN